MIRRDTLTAGFDHPATRTMIFYLLLGGGAFLLVMIALRFSTTLPGGSEVFLPVLGMALLVLPAAIVIPPVIPLFLAVMFLESPLPLLLDNKPSALLTGGLLGLAAFGCLFSPVTHLNTVSLPVRRSVWFFGVCGLLSAAKGLWLGNSSEYVIGDLFQVEEFVAVFILVSLLVNNETIGVRLLKCALGATYVNSVWQLVQSATGLSIGEGLPSVDSDVGGFVSRTISLDAIYVFVVVVSLYRVIPVRRRYWLWILLGPTVANLVFSFTRGVWVASTVGFLTCTWLLSKEQRLRLLKVAALIVFGIAAISSVWQIGGEGSQVSLLDAIQARLWFGMSQVQQGWEGDIHVQTRRFVEIAMIAPQVMSSPFLGTGMGALYSIDAAAMFAESTGLIDYHYMHNLYLRVAFRMGLLGLAAFCFVLYFYFRSSLRHYFAMPDDSLRALTAGLIAAVAAQVVLSMTSPTLLEHPMAGLAGCTMALTLRFVDFRASWRLGLPNDSVLHNRADN